MNLEYRARRQREEGGRPFAFPDTLIGTDSHTTMVNGLGVLGWGVGGIEAEAVLLGEPVSMLVPQVVGFRLSGKLPEGATATDLVLAVTQIPRSLGVVGKFVEYFGHGLRRPAARRPRDHREHVAGVRRHVWLLPRGRGDAALPAPHGAWSAEQVELVEAYCRVQGLFHDLHTTPEYSQVVELDLGDVEPSLAGPRRPQRTAPLTQAKASFLESLSTFGVPYRNGSEDKAMADSFPASDPPDFTSPATSPSPTTTRSPSPGPRRSGGHRSPRTRASSWSTARSSSPRSRAARTRRTPSVMVAAGLLAKNAVERGLARKPWVKSSLAPGSRS